jgi:ElaA protein
MNWKIKKFEELTTDELYMILKVRNEVFILEQTCPFLDCDICFRVSSYFFIVIN